MEKNDLRTINNVFNLFNYTNEIVERAITDFIIDVCKNEETIDCTDISNAYIKVDVQNSFTDEYNSYTLNEVLVENGNNIIISAYDNVDNHTNLYWENLTLADKVSIAQSVYNNIVEIYEKI